MKLVLTWLEQRLGLGAWFRGWMNYPVRGGAKLGHGFGAALVVLFLVQCLTGAALAAFYAPSTTDAWASVAYIETQVYLGGVIRGIHHHATSAMVILAVLHVAWTVFRRAYRAPGEVNWWVGWGLLALILAYPMTGYTLPWDQLGYWSANVRSGITGSMPMIGSWLRGLAIAGNDLGNLTLTRTYALHVLVLPTLTFALLFAHLKLFAKSGFSSSDSSAEVTEPYWARQLAYDLSVAAVVSGLVLALAVAVGARLDAPADPTTNYLARPEWFFLPLFQLLKFFDGPLQIIGTAVVPGLVSAFLLAVPFIDQGMPTIRPRVICLMLLIGAASLAASAVWHDALDPRIDDNRQWAERESKRALTLAEAGVPVQGAAFMMQHDPLALGERVFRARCRSCHALEGFVPKEPLGPDLTAYRSRAWLRQLLRDPEGPRFFGTTDIEGMPSYADLDESTLARLVEFLYTLRDQEGFDVEEHPEIELITKMECADCHDYEDDYALEGPTMRAYLSESYVRAMVMHPEADHLYGEVNEMPAFESKLNPRSLDAVVTFLMSLEHRAKASDWPFVDEPVVTPPRKLSTD